MRTISLLLTFLLNACWQVALVVAAAALSARLLRRAATRYRHMLWVTALVAALGLPVLTSSDLLQVSLSSGAASRTTNGQETARETTAQAVLTLPLDNHAPADGVIRLNRNLAWTLGWLYLSFLVYRSVSLFGRWRRTRAITRNADPVELREDLQTIIAKCESAFGVSGVRVLESKHVSIPVAAGVFRPVVILPKHLLVGGEPDILTSAIGHELAHVACRDYLLNLIYELIYLPVSFHPGSTLVRRRINQTRELRADELVCEKLLDPETYARSLVRLADAALPVAARARTIIVGIADADILEVRIMSLLNRPNTNTGRNRLLLMAASLLLAAPCAGAGALTPRFNIDTRDSGTSAQETSQQQQEVQEKQARKQKFGFAYEAPNNPGQDLKDKEARKRNLVAVEVTTNSTQQEQEQKDKVQQDKDQPEKEKQRMEGWAFKKSLLNDPSVRAEIAEKQKVEMDMQAVRNAALARLVKVSIDEAIKIASDLQQGKVLECSLFAEHWDAPGKLAEGARVFYHVVIFSGDETDPVTTHVLINAIDGSAVKKPQKGIDK